MVGHVPPLEVAKTVLEVADVAWSAVETYHHHHHHNHHDEQKAVSDHKNRSPPPEEELEFLRSENKLLKQNLKLLQDLSESHRLLQDCPPDLHARLVAAVDSTKFLTQIQSFRHESVGETGCNFPFKEATGIDLQSAEILINVDLEEPSWWVWVTDEMVPSSLEEQSEIDGENYVVIGEEHVVDGVADFMARCVLLNPKAQTLSPEELQKSLAKALEGGASKFEKILNIWHAGQIFYVMSTWGLALAGLYKSRAVVKLAAKGVHTTSKLVLRAL